MNSAAVRQFRVKQVAEFLSLSVREIFRLVAEGSFPPPVKIGRCSIWFESDIIEFQMRLRSQRERKTA
jgi:predicted DNA-binding transcriptional regulator AlpA